MNKVGNVAVGGICTAVFASALSLAGYCTYLDSTDEALENISSLAKKYDENKNNKLDHIEAIKLVVNEFDENKDGHLSKEEKFELNRFLDKFRGRFQHGNIQKARQMLAVASAYCGEWGEEPQHIKAIKEYWSEPEKEVMLKYIALRNNKKSSN